ncbi:P22 coat protein-gene protein 5 [Alistipes timonensis JC136]|uniref:p22 coat protein-gene protein 5 n=1 Tax=Alistipes timonensis JC136 TaxID=1033731 RepID=A0A1H4DCG1_9BACT|nr:P22 phage major capsid protein family protein [Alistipes timonensis]SEA70445.1 P22 coat protein-gene protein 5 [Alistipes timonensis JC136]
MALQVEIWVKSIIEGLFANNTFAARSVDHSEFVNNKTVHVPNAGAAPNVEKNRTVFPASVTKREDVDLTYDMDEFTVDPVRISHAEQVELSYNKRESIVRQSRRKLAQDIYDSIIYDWIPEGVKVVETIGAAVAAHIKGATGDRKLMTKKTVEELQTLFDEQDLPEEGRCILLDARMYNQLMNSMTDAEQNNFLNCADPARGVIGKYLGFDFYKRSKVAKVATDGTVKPWSAADAATDCAAGLAWHEDCVSRALGESVLFDDEGNPLFYGDVISFLQRAGGKSIRADKAGIVLIKQGTAA